MDKNPKSMLENDRQEKTLSDDIPVNADLTSGMLIDVSVNKNSEVWVFHNKPFPNVLEWIEYDAEESSLVFVTKGGRLNDLGIKIGPLMHKYLHKANEAAAFLVFDNQIHDVARVPIIVRGTLH